MDPIDGFLFLGATNAVFIVCSGPPAQCSSMLGRCPLARGYKCASVVNCKRDHHLFFQMKRSCLKFIWRRGKGVLLNTGHEMSFSLWRYSKLYEVYFLIYFWVIFDNQLNYLIKALSDRQNLHQLPLQDVFTFRIQKSIPIVFTMVCKIRALINKSQVAVTL